MKRSTEVAAATEKFYDALNAGDLASLTALMSTNDGLLFIGTDPDEWLADPKEVTDAFAATMGAGVKVRGGDIEAYEEDSVGWIADRAAFILPDGSEAPFRLTAVFHRQDGQWKMIQSHASFAISNEQAMGIEL